MEQTNSFGITQDNGSVSPMPAVTVLLSAYNNRDYIIDQVESILNQIGVVIRLCIRVDGATDGTMDIICSRYGGRHNIQIIEGENLGPAGSFMELMRKCRRESKFYAFSDADDVWHAEKCVESVGALPENSESRPMGVVVKQQIVDAHLRYLGVNGPPPRGYSLSSAIVQTDFPGHALLFNRQALEMAVLGNPRYFVMHDAWMYLILTAFGDIKYVDRPLVLYRQHRGNYFGVSFTFGARLVARMKRFRRPVHDFHQQACEFLKIYSNALDPKKRSIVQCYVEYKSSLLATVKFSIYPTFRKQSRMSQFYSQLRCLFRAI